LSKLFLAAIVIPVFFLLFEYYMSPYNEFKPT